MANIPFPSVPDFIAGYGPQQSDMYSLWTSPATFFQDRMVLRVSQSSASQNLPDSGAVTTITFDTVLEDPYGGWSATSHSWTPPTGLFGWFQVTITVWVSSPGLDVVLAPSILTATSVSSFALADITCNSGQGAAEGTYFTYLNGGQDNVAGQAKVMGASSAVATDITAGQQSTMEIIWLAA
jgi:hypothetical protein